MLRILIVVLVLLVAAMFVLPRGQRGAAPQNATELPQPTPLADVRFVDKSGREAHLGDFKGDFTLLFFGFTNCPDVCPTALQVMAAALDKLGPNAARITPVLISVDPAHDTPAVLATYVASFHPRLVGLTGSQAEIDAVAKAYRVYVKKVPDPKSTAGYTMDHSSIIYVMGPDGSYRAHFTHATSPDVMAERLSGLLQRPTM